jgi:two-component system chemotaxis sensor kinase CheA
VRATPEAVTRTADGQELVLVRERLYPVLRLHVAHGIAPDHREPWEGLLVLLEHPEHPFALLVDELLGHQQTVVKGLASYLGVVPGVSGCSILGDGDVSLILDVNDLAGRTNPSDGKGIAPALALTPVTPSA